MVGRFELVRALNHALADLARHATVGPLSEPQVRQMERAVDLLEEVTRLYMDSPPDMRRRIRAAAGYCPDIRESWLQVVRRRLSFWPRRKGNYSDALWIVAMSLSHRAVTAGLTRDSFRMALGALGVEGARYDWRDTLTELRTLEEAAAAAGLDAAPLLEEAATRERSSAIGDSPSMAALIESTRRT